MSALRSGNHRRYEEDEENAGADQIASIVRVLVSVQPTHGHRAAARFPKRRGKDFDDPEAERHFGDLAQESIVVLHLSLASRRATAPVLRMNMTKSEVAGRVPIRAAESASSPPA